MGTLKEIDYGIGKYLTASDASGIPGIGNNRKNLDLLNFKIASNNAYTLYKFKDGFIDAYQDQTGVNIAVSTNESYDSTNKVYNTALDVVESHTATGTITWTAPTGVTSVEYLVVAGGGGGGSRYGGGGGAGGFLTGTHSVTPGNDYTLTVGAGGAAGASGTYSGTNGADSVFSSITSVGGGGGAVGTGGSAITTGGSGGGGSGNGSGSWNSGASGTGGQGYAGGDGVTGDDYPSGGGGGASAVGITPTNNAAPSGDGGAGLASSITGSSVTYAGGGGGGGNTQQSPGREGAGGTGGGGKGGDNSTTTGVAGTDGLGGGGGGGYGNGSSAGGAGGSGIVIITYTASGMTLKSNAQTANAEPTEGRLMLYEEDVDSITLDTDIKGYVSRDGGTTYTQTPLVQDVEYNPTYYTKLLLHCDGANDGTTFTDSSAAAATMEVSSVVTKTGTKKYGTASCYFPGTNYGSGSYPVAGCLMAPNGENWNFGDGDWTLELWINFVGAIGGYDEGLITNSVVNNSGFQWIYNEGTKKFDFWPQGNGSVQYNSNALGAHPTAGTWYHFAITRQSSTLRHYVDGVQIGSNSDFTDTLTLSASSAARLTIGAIAGSGGGTPAAFRPIQECYMDEIRVSKGICRYPDGTTFTPSGPFDAEWGKRLLSGSVDISGQPAGTDMKYKVETLNNKNLKLHGASLLWA